MAKSNSHSQNTAPAESEPAKRSFLLQHPLPPVLLIVLAGMLVYANSLWNGFVFDDIGTIVENKYINEFGKNLPSFFTTSYFVISGVEGSYRPIATLSYYLLYAAFGLNPFGYHLASVLLHVLNSVLLYLLLGRILRNRLTSLFAALMFACHPVITEAVNCISYNEDLLSALFYFLAFLLHVVAVAEDKNVKKGFYVFSLICFLFGLLSKEMAITLPGMIVLYDAAFREIDYQGNIAKQILNTFWRRKFYYGGYLAVSLFYMSLRFLILVTPKVSLAPSYGRLIERIIYLPVHLFTYMKMAVLPLNLNAEYVFAYPVHFFEIINIIGLAVVAGLLLLSFYLFKRSKEISFGMWWFLITLFPVYNLIEIANPIAERYLYLPLVGFCIITAIILNDIINRVAGDKATATGVLKACVILAILGFYASVTVARNRDWKDDLSLWTKTRETSPNSSIVHGNLGRAYHNLGMLKEAEDSYQTAIKVNPSDSKAYYNLGTLYEEQGDLRKAVRYYKRTTELNPGFVDSHFNLANIYAQMGMLEEAVPHLKKAVEFKPGDFEARNNLGVLYARLGKLDLAIAEWEAVIKIDPGNQEARGNILKAKKMLNK